MSLVVTGATGPFGRLVVESLIERGVPASDITATGRSIDRISDLAAAGVRVVASDYDDPASLDVALAGARVVVLVSGNEFGRRVEQHRNVVEAAARAGVGRIVYTSIPKADETPLLLAAEHRATEEAIAASGLPYTFVRNSWYVENYLPQIPTYLEHGIVGAAGEGRVSLAPRRDYADAAAVVATTDGHENAVYELGGESITLAELAAIVGEAAGRPVAYTDVDEDTLRGILVDAAGFPEPVAATFADVDSGIRAGWLHVTSGDLERLIGREPEPVVDSVKAAVASL